MRLTILLPLFLSLGMLACEDTAPSDGPPDAGASIPDSGGPAPDGGSDLDGGEPADGGVPGDGGGVDSGGGPIGNPAAGAWSETFGLPGVSGVPGAAVRVFASGRDGLYAGGEFVQMSGVSAKGVARWTGSAWTSLGEGLDITVNGLTFDGRGELWAGGLDSGFGPPGSPILFSWDGQTWTPGPGVQGDFPRITTLTTLADGRMVAGGAFAGVDGVSAPNLAVRTPNGWEAWGSSPNGTVHAVMEDPEGRACIGGEFSQVGDQPAFGVACWDETAGDWRGLGRGLPGFVFALIPGDAAGELIAGGNFTFVDDLMQERAGLAHWDGQTWRPLGGGVQNGEINSVRALARDTSGRLLVGGHFFTVDRYGNSVPVSHLARWDGRAWTDLGGGVSGGVGVFAPGVLGVYALFPLEQDGLLIGGMFLRGGETTSQGVVRFDAQGFSPLAGEGQSFQGVSGFVDAVAIDESGRVYIGGDFSQAGSAEVSDVARFENGAWAPVGESLGGFVARVVIEPQSQQPWIAGQFELAGEVGTVGLARLQDDAWQPLGEPLNGEVSTILFHSSGDVYVGGSFDRVGGVAANNVARFDGTVWHAVGSGLQGREFTSVNDLVEDSAGQVWATGAFRTTGDGRPARGIAAFDGARWEEMGGLGDVGGLEGRGTDLAVSGTDIYLAGTFPSVGGVPALSIARWDGSQWHPLGEGFSVFELPASVTSIEALGGTLFATGAFGFDSQLNHIAWWNGTTWMPLAEGLSDLGTSMVVRDRDLWVGGPFGQAGGRVSVGVARWTW